MASYDRICKMDAWCFELVYFIQKYMEDKIHEAPDLANDMMSGFDDEPDEKKDDVPPPDQQANPFNNAPSANDLADAPDLDADLL